MARSPIEIPIASETGAFEKGIKSGIIEPLEDAEKALKDLGESRGPEQLERDMRDAQKQTEKLKDETERAADAIEKDFKRAYREAKESGTDSMGRIQSATQEVTQEVGSNLGEAVSSIRGDTSDLGQVGQDTLGGLAATVSGMGPAGLAGAFALAAGAVGLGALTAGQEEAREKQEKLNEAAAKFAEGYLEGINGAISGAQVFAEINAIATDPDRYKTAGDNAKAWGVDVATAMRAMAGDATALQVVDQSLDKQADALERNSAGADNYAQSIEQATTGQSSANSKYLEGRAALDQINQAMDIGRQQAENAQKALYEYASQVGVATGKTDDLGNAIVKLPDGKEIVMDAETKTANENVDAFEQKVQNVRDKTVRMRVALDSSEWDRWTPGAKVGRVRTAVEPGGGGGTTWF